MKARCRQASPAPERDADKSARYRRFSGQYDHTSTGFTLIELLCVIAILGILASLFLPAITRAYSRIKGEAQEMEAPAIASLLVKESRSYCAANPQFYFQSKADFDNKCWLSPKCGDWVEASTTEFAPFNYQDPSNRVVLSVYIGRNRATRYTFSKGDLSSGAEGQ